MEVTITVKTKRKIKLPKSPNFLRDENGEPIAVENFTQDQLQEIGEQWTKVLKQKARDKSGQRMKEINKRLGNWT